MTVAAVILAASEASALADAGGTPVVRRLADVAWAGGATPAVVCSFDPDGAVASILANTQAVLVEPAPMASGPVGQIAAGCDAAVRLVAETDAALVWPARFGWVDAGTVTALIAAHGEDRDAVLRPAFGGEDGFPVLLPMTRLAAFRALATTRMPGELFGDLAATGVPLRSVDSGDPGVTHDVSVTRADLPPYEGPPEPVGAPAHEWGAAAADDPDDAPVSGPARVASAKPDS
jgi:CTP:molybdopterin cytidylyltransferase MocA